MSSVLSFVFHRVDQIKTGGLVVLRKKIIRAITLLIFLPLYPIALPFVVFSRFIKPFIQIRYGRIRSDVIGHLAFATEYYLSERHVDQSRTLDYFYYESPELPNKHLPIMYKRVMKIHPFIRYCDHVNRLLPGSEQHHVNLYDSPCRDTRNIFMRTPCHIKFTNEEIDKGERYLKKTGLKADQNYVCMIARDTAYKNIYQNFINMDWSYHSYRNSDINNYVKAAESLTKENYFVFRIGKGVNGKIETINNKIIDYSNTEDRNDFLDIYLSANCSFFLVGESGLSTVPNVYRVPIVFVNFASIEYVYSWNSNIITIFKKYWLKEEKRFMTFKEIYNSGAGRFLLTEQYEKLGIELIENTPDEILDVSMEMHHRLNNTWETTEEDEVLQKMFWDHLPKSELHGEIFASIGAAFLRQNRELLN